MKPWEIAGVCLAVAIGSAVGVAYLLADTINGYLNWDPLHAADGGHS
jgi:hypothetical protein